MYSETQLEIEIVHFLQKDKNKIFNQNLNGGNC